MSDTLSKHSNKIKSNKSNRRCKKKYIKTFKKSKGKRKKNFKKTRKKSENGSKSNKIKKNVTILPDTTPKVNKELRENLIEEGKRKIPLAPHSFSPKINQLVDSLKSISPHYDIVLNICKSEQIKIKMKNGHTKCVGLKTKLAQNIMIDNLLSNRPVDCNKIIAPKQILDNCWFNAFFMIFFISDKGRKFFRYLRLAMITGKLPNGNSIPSSLRMPFLLLNKYIEASLLGSTEKASTSSFITEDRLADVMDTNVIIRKIAKAIGEKKRIEYSIAKTSMASNPLTFYEGIVNYLKDSSISFVDISEYPSSINFNAPDIYVLSVDSEDNMKKFKIKKNFNVIQGNNRLAYKLDSAVLRDTKEEHFSSYITCNGKPFASDGESFSRMVSFDWFKKLNIDTQWRFAEQHDTYFNFAKGAYLLFYYRIR